MNCSKLDCVCINNEECPKLTIKVLKDSICPKCHVVTTKNIDHCFYTVGNSHGYVYIVRVCGHCGEVAFHKHTIYHIEECHDRLIDLSKQFYNEFPPKKMITNFDESIEELSPNFVEIFHQAEIAEREECNEICGMGYRKALEFLVKDYLIHKNPKLELEVSNESLSATIRRIDDTRIKLLAQRSAWLGNDECHYIRKHEDYSINDLKLFISALVHFVESELIFEKANTLQARN